MKCPNSGAQSRLTKDAEFLEERSHEIVRALNDDDDSPWKNLIKMTGTGQGIISQAAFITELRRLLQDTVFKEYAIGEQIKLLKDYFSAVKELFPDAWASRKHVLCKTLGLAAILRIMPKILVLCAVHDSNVCSIEFMKKHLNGLTEVIIQTESGGEPLDFTGKQLGRFGGKKGQQALALMIEKGLPQIRPI